MAITKHSPAPWKNGRDANGDVVICQTEYAQGDEWNSEYQANRRLFDAAPDLLDALKTVTDHFADVMGGPQMAHIKFQNGVEGIPTIVKARAAITKAEGK
jgi:hypothetical protein